MQRMRQPMARAGTLPRLPKGRGEVSATTPEVAAIVEYFVGSGFDPSYAGYHEVAQVCLDALLNAGYTLSRRAVENVAPEVRCTHGWLNCRCR